MGQGRHAVWAEIQSMGEDIIVLIGGGDEPHIGCVCIATHYEKRDGKIGSSALSIFNVPGHKDEVIVRRFAEELAKHFQTTVLCAGGVHINDATESDIKLVLENADKLLIVVKRAIEAGNRKE